MVYKPLDNKCMVGDRYSSTDPWPNLDQISTEKAYPLTRNAKLQEEREDFCIFESDLDQEGVIDQPVP